MGGAIAVESDGPSKGATFSVTLPVHSGEASGGASRTLNAEA